MVYRPNIDREKCFVLLPLRTPFLGYFEKIIKPAALSAGLTAVKADDIYGTRAVIRDIWELIWTARIVIAIVTDQNPNVNYELGMCHTLGVPTILVTEKAEDVPFDYRHRRYVRYLPLEAGWEQKLSEDIRNTIRTILPSTKLEDELPWPYSTFDLSAPRTTGQFVPSEDSLDLVVRGASLVRRSVASAFGPQGARVSVRLPPHDRQTSYRRGHKIAQGIRSDNPLEKQGIEQMRTLAGEIYSATGDATKTGIFLSCGMIDRGAEALRLGCVPKSLVSGMERAIQAAATYVMTDAKTATAEQLRSVAETATGFDITSATVVIEALKRVGKNGVIEVVQGTGAEITTMIQEGMQFDSGFLSQRFVTDTDRQECVLEDCYVLLHEGQITSTLQILPVLEQVAKRRKPLLIIAADIAQEAMAVLILNKEKGALPCVAVKAPGQGDRRKALLEDMAVLTGGKAFLQELMRSLDGAGPSDLGRAEKVIVSKDNTTIIGGAGRPEETAARIQSLRRQIDATTSIYDLAKLRERLAKLAGAIALIKSGGLTEADIIDSAYKLESALNSCHAAMENGYVIGGGMCYYRAKELLEKLVATNESEKYGIAAVSYALELPLRQLIQNSKAANKEGALKQILQSTSTTVGFNAETGSIEDLFSAGVFDPAKTLKDALLLAFGYAKGILATGAWDTTPFPQGDNPTL